jgi:hypothetical protein
METPTLLDPLERSNLSLNPAELASPSLCPRMEADLVTEMYFQVLGIMDNGQSLETVIMRIIM